LTKATRLTPKTWGLILCNSETARERGMKRLQRATGGHKAYGSV